MFKLSDVWVTVHYIFTFKASIIRKSSAWSYEAPRTSVLMMVIHTRNRLKLKHCISAWLGMKTFVFIEGSVSFSHENIKCIGLITTSERADFHFGLHSAMWARYLIVFGFACVFLYFFWYKNRISKRSSFAGEDFINSHVRHSVFLWLLCRCCSLLIWQHRFKDKHVFQRNLWNKNKSFPQCESH